MSAGLRSPVRKGADEGCPCAWRRGGHGRPRVGAIVNRNPSPSTTSCTARRTASSPSRRHATHQSRPGQRARAAQKAKGRTGEYTELLRARLGPHGARRGAVHAEPAQLRADSGTDGERIARRMDAVVGRAANDHTLKHALLRTPGTVGPTPAFAPSWPTARRRRSRATRRALGPGGLHGTGDGRRAGGGREPAVCGRGQPGPVRRRQPHRQPRDGRRLLVHPPGGGPLRVHRRQPLHPEAVVRGWPRCWASARPTRTLETDAAVRRTAACAGRW